MKKKYSNYIFIVIIAFLVFNYWEDYFPNSGTLANDDFQKYFFNALPVIILILTLGFISKINNENTEKKQSKEFLVRSNSVLPENIVLDLSKDYNSYGQLIISGLMGCVFLPVLIMVALGILVALASTFSVIAEKLNDLTMENTKNIFFGAYAFAVLVVGLREYWYLNNKSLQIKKFKGKEILSNSMMIGLCPYIFDESRMPVSRIFSYLKNQVSLEYTQIYFSDITDLYLTTWSHDQETYYLIEIKTPKIKYVIPRGEIKAVEAIFFKIFLDHPHITITDKWD